MNSVIETRWTEVGCDICGAAAGESVELGRRRMTAAQRRHDYSWHHRDVQCSRCGFVFNALRPAGNFLRDYYADCWPIASSRATIEPDFSIPTRLAVLQRWLKPAAKVYEIGGKLGEFHSALLATGYSVVGDDVMIATADREAWLSSLFAQKGPVAPPPAFRAAFDGVLAYFVVEHLANPVEWLAALRACLKPGGVLVIEVPHFVRHPAEGLMHEHFLYFTPDALARMLARAGFEVVENETLASRPFGFCVVAKQTEGSANLNAGATPTAPAVVESSYRRGRELLEAAANRLAVSAQLAASLLAEDGLARVCFFGANPTATEIVGHLRAQMAGQTFEAVVFDNADAKRGTNLPGVEVNVDIPVAGRFAPDVMQICIVCSRGWTQQIAAQIRGFALPNFVIIDGPSGRFLPTGGPETTGAQERQMIASVS